MKIALINENSQAAKNALIEKTLREVVEPKGFTVVNYGMYSADDKAQLTYVQEGLLAAILLNSGAADFVVTGCGTGEGATLAMNAFTSWIRRTLTCSPRSMPATRQHFRLPKDSAGAASST